MKLSRTDGCSITTTTVLKEYETGTSPGQEERQINIPQLEDMSSHITLDDVPTENQADQERGVDEDDALLQQMKEVKDQNLLSACTSTFYYNPPQITRHAITGVF